MPRDRKEYNREWRRKNRDYIRETRRAYQRDYKHKEHLRDRYKITLEYYNELLARQLGVCAICRQTNGDKRLAVDHCHETGRVRGLLCNGCNLGLGGFRDDATRLRLAAEYLNANV